MRKNIAIVFGGCSSEYDVSLQSAYAIARSIDPAAYQAIFIGITRDGHWFRYHGDMKQIAEDSWHGDEGHCTRAMFSPDRYANTLVEFRPEGVTETPIDLVFPVLHGKNGEDGTMQGLLELAGIPFVGCDTLSSALCMDKDRAHKFVEQAGIRVPRAAAFPRGTSPAEIAERTEALVYPLFVKPVRAGSSIGITMVHSPRELPKAVGNAFLHDDQVIVEENVPGFEVGCAVIGNAELTVGEVDEIELAEGFFDFKEKYGLNRTRIHMPARIDGDTAVRIKETAKAIYRALGCRGLARVDMFLTPDKEIVFNEVNTFPGFTAHSRFPNMMKGIGMTFEQLVETLIRTGLSR